MSTIIIINESTIGIRFIKVVKQSEEDKILSLGIKKVTVPTWA